MDHKKIKKNNSEKNIKIVKKWSGNFVSWAIDQQHFVFRKKSQNVFFVYIRMKKNSIRHDYLFLIDNLLSTLVKRNIAQKYSNETNLTTTKTNLTTRKTNKCFWKQKKNNFLKKLLISGNFWILVDSLLFTNHTSTYITKHIWRIAQIGMVFITFSKSLWDGRFNEPKTWHRNWLTRE